MTHNYYSLLDLASSMDVFVDFDDMGWLPKGHKGGWFPKFEVILLAQNLNHIDQLCTLAHELGHAHHGHVPGAQGWWSARQEQQADQFAVELLISPVEYELAENLYGSNHTTIAHELGVTTRLIATWQNLYERTLR